MALTQREATDELRPLRISVLTGMDPAIPRVSPIGDLRFCAGLAADGHRVELVAPAIERRTPAISELLTAYDLEPNFEVRYIPVPRTAGWRDSRIVLALFRHHMLAAMRPSRPEVVLSRDVRLLLPYVASTRMGIRDFVTAPWLHEFRGKRRERVICAKSTCVLATNSAILSDLAKQGVSNPRTFVTGNPAPRERVEFARTFSKAEARGRLGLDLRQPVIAYTGKIYLGMRELDYLLEAASRIPDCLFVLNGGQPHVTKRLAEELRGRNIANVRLVGMLSKPEEARFYQKAADVLVTYHSIVDHPYADHNLPNKLAEYMATGNPIVAADSPSVRDLLNPGNAILVRRDDVEAFTKALAFAVRCRDQAVALGARAQRDIAPLTSESVGAELGRFLASAAADRSGKERRQAAA